MIVRDKKSQSVSVDVSLGKIYNSPGSSYVGSGNPMYGSGGESPSVVRQHLEDVNPQIQSVFGASVGCIYNSPGFSRVEGSNPMHGSGSNGRPMSRQHLVSGSGNPFSASTSSAVTSVADPNLILPKDGKVSSAAVSSAAGSVLVHFGTGPTGPSGRSANSTTVSYSTTTPSAAANQIFADVELSYGKLNRFKA